MLLVDFPQNFLRSERELLNAHSGSVIYGIPDRSHHRRQKGFADAVKLFGAYMLQGRGVDRQGDIGERRNVVVAQVWVEQLAVLSVVHFLEQGLTQPENRTAFQLQLA